MGTDQGLRSQSCCQAASSASSHKEIAARTTNGDLQTTTFTRRCLQIARWLVPSAILTLLPKCPACLAAYVALGAGITLSVSTATYLRMALLILCTASLVYLTVKPARRLIRKHS